MIRFYAGLLNLLRHILRNVRRTGLNRGTCLVFVGVVIESLKRSDLNDRIRLSVHNAAGEFPAADVLLYDQNALVGKCVIHRFLILFRRPRDADSDTGAAAGRLYHTGKTYAVLIGTLHFLTPVQNDTLRGRDIIFPKQLLGQVLVHRERTSKVTASGVRDTKQFKCCLEFAVFTVRSVKRHEHCI